MKIEAFGSTSFAQAWEHVMHPWFRARTSFMQPALVLVPTASVAASIKSMALEHAFSLLNIQFLTPGGFRSLLVKKFFKNKELSPLREDLHLLMRLVALEFLKENEDSNTAKVVLNNPERAVELYDILNTANQPYNLLQDKELEQLLSTFSKNLEENHLFTVQSVDKQLENFSFNEICFKEALIYGFSHKNWSADALVRVVTKISETTQIILHSTLSGSVSEQAWIGNWEALWGEVKLLPELEVTPFNRLSEDFQCPQLASRAKADLDFYLLNNVWDEADLVVELVKNYLEQGASKIGIIVPSSIALIGREISKRLESLNIPHYDHLGHTPAPSGNAKLFLSFLDWQKSPRISLFLKFLELLYEFKKIAYVDFSLISSALDKSFNYLMTEDTAVLFAYIKTTHFAAYQVIVDVLAGWPQFPDDGEFSQYVELMKRVVEKTHYPELSLLESRASVLLRVLKKPITKGFFLSWVTSVCHTLGRIRSSVGGHFFAPVQLLTQDQALYQSCSHVILTSLNEASWPRNYEQNPLLSDAVIMGINQATLCQGPQGEGNIVTKQGSSLLHTSIEKRVHDEVLFAQLLGVAKEELIFTAHLNDVQSSGKVLEVSEFFERVYLFAEGRLISPEILQSIVEYSEHWLRERREEIFIDKEDVASSIKAYQARRNPLKKFDEYTYSLGKPLSQVLSAKTWENVLQFPEEVWLKHILKLKKPMQYQTQEAKALAVGTWVHDWLTINSEDLTIPQKTPTEANWRESVFSFSYALKSSVSRAFKDSGKGLPAWWLAHFEEAQKIALDFTHHVSAQLEEYFLLSEYTLLSNSKIKTAQGVEIPISGRIDLIAANTQLPVTHPDAHLWILDYKTAKRAGLTPHMLRQGKGLQLALYALALHHAGVQKIDISLITHNVIPKTQVSLEKILELKDVLDAIALINVTGVFGQKNAGRNEYAYTPDLPYASTSIEEEILRSKWNLTHNTFSW